MWLPLSGPASVLVAGLLLASCAAPTPKPSIGVLPPPPPPLAARPSFHAAWSFKTEPGACLAFAAAGHTRLELAVRGAAPIQLGVTLPSAGSGLPVAHFRGPVGTWAVQGWHAGHHRIVFTLGRGTNALSRVLMLLSGGVLDLQSPDRRLPIVTLAASGAEGQRWFACVRHNVI